MLDALPLYRAESVLAIERAAATQGLDATTLMSRAGAAAAALLRERWPSARRVGVLVGPGNNGGDGYVAALALRQSGLAVSVVAVGSPSTPEAAAAAERWRASGDGVGALGDALPSVDVWIDALFGTGFRRPADEALSGVLQAINATAQPVLAIDLPIGIFADTGAPLGTVLRAEVTLCLVGAKRGLFTAAGREAAGEVRLDTLGVPDSAFSDVAPDALAIAASILPSVLPRRGGDTHKGRFGRVLCIGCDVGYEGALVLCAESAARSGAGSVLAWSRPGAVSALHQRRPEVMARAVVEEDASAASIRDSGASVLAFGPGLGQAAWGQAWLSAALESGLPMVIDADALNLIATTPRDCSGAILTPHPGEAARLLNTDIRSVQADRFAAAAALAEARQAVVVLKGAGTIIAAPGEVPRVLRAGHPGMATAGMGDVLTGLIAGLRGQGLPAFEAAWTGALAHSVAADHAGRQGARGLLAGDVIKALREVLNP